jgi:hypothetical protein
MDNRRIAADYRNQLNKEARKKMDRTNVYTRPEVDPTHIFNMVLVAKFPDRDKDGEYTYTWGVVELSLWVSLTKDFKFTLGRYALQNSVNVKVHSITYHNKKEGIQNNLHTFGLIPDDFYPFYDWLRYYSGEIVVEEGFENDTVKMEEIKKRIRFTDATINNIFKKLCGPEKMWIGDCKFKKKQKPLSAKEVWSSE